MLANRGAHGVARSPGSSCSRRGAAVAAEVARPRRPGVAPAHASAAAAPASTAPAPTHGAGVTARQLASQPAPPHAVISSAGVTARQLASQPAPPHAVISSLVGKRLLQLAPGHAVVPLLHPVHDQLPFAAGLHVYSQHADAAAAQAAPAQEQQQQDSGLVELSYVLSGAGFFTSSAGFFTSSAMQQLRPGDSILARQGAAAFAAGPLPTTTEQQQEQQDAPPAWSGQLLSWLHQLTGNGGDRRQQDPGTAPAGSSSSSSARLVVLQLLLPSELLTGQLLAHHAGHYQAVAQHLPWAGAQEQQQQLQDSAPSVPGAAIEEDEVCGFLADVSAAGAAPPGHQQADGGQLQEGQQQEPQQEAQQQEAQQQEEAQPQDHDPQRPTEGLSSTTVLKRALSEVGAFRLPQQTNRLALLFGPTSGNPVAGTPALSLSFGVEVFEPSHITPLHVHTTAHELFFVLAGRGEGVFGGRGSSSSSEEDGQQQRVRLTAGDVAVFAPGLRHGIDNASDAEQLWCIQLMLPNEAFVEWVSSGELAGGRIDLELAAAAASCG